MFIRKIAEFDGDFKTIEEIAKKLGIQNLNLRVYGSKFIDMLFTYYAPFFAISFCTLQKLTLQTSKPKVPVEIQSMVKVFLTKVNYIMSKELNKVAHEKIGKRL